MTSEPTAHKCNSFYEGFCNVVLFTIIPLCVIVYIVVYFTIAKRPFKLLLLVILFLFTNKLKKTKNKKQAQIIQTPIIQYCD